MRTYPNLFLELGISQEEIDKKINDTFETMFFDPEERIYFEMGDDMGYMLDTGNNDARTEGMSYGMMMAVQMDRKDIFDRLWLFSKTYMYQKSGKYKGYFAWSVAPDGSKNAEGPAPDGEEYFAMALFFASERWGDGEEPFNYSVQAREILRHCIHQDELVEGGEPMWDNTNYYIKFVPEADFTDPSYHLPHFYEIFAQRSDPQDREFWKKAAEESRKYLHLACHPITGMAPEYAEYDGTPKRLFREAQFYSDSYRVAMNIGLDAAWFNKDESLG
ncbi:MAG: xylanase, partial [Clostridiaceae bacterium]|nr:xylanase [Clostridiaceae bacterium]